MNNIEKLKFDIKNGDAFGNIATIVSCVRQSKPAQFSNDTLKKVEDRLMYLHKNYKLIKKT